MKSQFKQPRAGGIDTPTVGTGAGIRAGFEETRCQGNLTKTGEHACLRTSNARTRVYERSTRDYESLRKKKNQLEYNDIYLS